MGIGGLDKEFSDIFRRAFASRVFQLMLPRRWVLNMYEEYYCTALQVRATPTCVTTPPSLRPHPLIITGTGKTLMARQIGKMLHAREPKIVNGPGKLEGPQKLTEMKFLGRLLLLAHSVIQV